MVVKPGARLVQLDLLRGLAIFAVLGMHSPSEPGGSGALRPLDAFIHRYGWTGVDLFFVLSGYLLGGLVFTELKQYGNFDAKRFILRRGMRIWPSYYFLLAYLFLQLWLDPHVGFDGAWEKLWPAFVHIQNFILAPRDHLWSLAVEEHFYALLPVFLWLITRRDGPRGLAWVPIACIGLSLGSTALRAYLALRGSSYGQSRTETFMCLDALFFGVNLAYLKAYRPAWLDAITARKWTLGLGLLLLLPAGVRSTLFLHAIGYTLVYLGYALILIHVVSVQPGQGVAGNWLLSWPARLTVAVGINSYSIYLWHRDGGWLGYLFSRWLTRVAHVSVELRWLSNTFAFVVAGILAGALLDKLVEQPTQRLRAKLFPPRSATLPAASASVSA